MNFGFGQLEEDLAMATQHMFSSTATATSVLTATGESPVLVETTKHMQSMTTTLNVTHAGTCIYWVPVIFLGVLSQVLKRSDSCQ